MPRPELNGKNSQDEYPEQNGQFDETIELARLSDLFRLDPGTDADGSLEDRVDATEGMPVFLIPPPEAVWAQIAAATGVRVDARAEAVRRNADTGRVADLAPELVGASGTPVTSQNPRLATVKELRPVSRPAVNGVTRPERNRRSEPLVMFLAAASLVIGLVGGAGAVVGLQRWGDGSTPAPAVSVLSSAALTGLPDAPAAAGEVDVLKTPTGRQLQVSVRRLGTADGFYEVWLADSTLDKMIPVGLLQGDTATFDLPGDVDPTGYPTVDISLEPMDGNPAHSSHSVLRGTLSE